VAEIHARPVTTEDVRSEVIWILRIAGGVMQVRVFARARESSAGILARMSAQRERI
jgi:hypothetical protein